MPFQFMDVEKEYEKNKDLKKEDIKILAEWMEKQPHLPKATELQLILFLHSCYYKLEATKNAIDNFFTVRTLCPDMFGFLSEENLKFQLSVGSIIVLPEKTPEGYSVILAKLLDCNPEHYSNVYQINYSDKVLLLNLHQKGTSEGILVIFDMKGLTFGHLTKFHLVTIRKHLFYVQEAAPIRIKGIHYINTVPFIDKLMAMVKPFMKKELVELLNFHTGSYESLYKFIPKKKLPKEYGGEAPSIDILHEQNSKNLLENTDFFKWLDTFKVDENRRPNKCKSASEIFGVDGTFKKLDID